MESIKIQFTDPRTGTDKYDTVKFDISKFRVDESNVPAENIFFTSAATGVSTIREVQDLAEASLVANPFNPYGCATPIAYGLVDAIPTGTTLTLTSNPTTAGFKANEPVAVMSDFSGANVVAYLTPTSVTTTSLVFGSDLSSVGIKENNVVVKMSAPRAYAPAFTFENLDWGAKALLEAPNAPAIDATGGAGSLTVTITPATTNAYVIKQYNIYAVSSTETFDPTLPVIFGNRKPDAAVAAGATLTSIPITTFGGGTDAGGGSIVAGTYYVVAVALDAASDMGGNCSKLSNIDMTSVS